MKRFVSVLSSLLVLPAFADVSTAYRDNTIEYSDNVVGVEDSVRNSGQRTNINRSASISRIISSAQNNASTRSNTSSRAVANTQRTTATESSRGTVARTAKTSNVTARAAVNTADTAVTSRSAQTSRSTVSRIGVRNNVMSGGTVALTDSGQSSRVGIANRRASSRLSTVSAPTTTTAPTITKEDVTAVTDNLSAVSELTDYCKSQYAACMDNYCNVLDDNQGRCSCSKNVKNYEKTEAALEQITESFQNVVQQIRYIGLSSDQIESLFTETEAELTMKSTTDTSRLKNSLDLIKKKIVDVSTPSASSSVTSGLSLDLNGLLTADFTAGFDLNSFLNMNSNSSDSVSNQRGEQLYKTASNRCKTAVLNSCANQGIDTTIITNAYDLEIDKQCVLYERSLNDANAEMKQNVTNASTILQQARLLLAQNRNSYDLRGCIAAIDSCMQDEYVCGSDYELCLDPTGKYISNGEIIKGGTPGVAGGQPRNKTICNTTGDVNENTTCLDKWVSNGMYFSYSTWDYTCNAITGTNTTATQNKCNAWSVGNQENLGAYVDFYMDKWKSDYKNTKDTTVSDYMALYLLQKIGYIDDNDKVHGMCASVMKQCQDYTYTTTSSKKGKKKYIADNEVIRQYLNATLPKIKVQQDAIISDYAESCKADVQSCLTTNGYEESNPDSTATKTAVNACASEITTCMSVGGYQITEGASLTLRDMADWVKAIMITCGVNEKLVDDGYTTKCEPCESVPLALDFNARNTPNAPYELPADDGNAYRLLTGRSATVQLVSSGGRVTKCSCPDGYEDYTVRGDDMASGAEVGKSICIDTTVECEGHTCTYK